ncbi:MAG: glycerol-3-phosphate 1-O-acyltransferase PlsY [Pseudomonadota bacterium]|nr:glycerol-3-phosphate 1-O-acyltransferase PlsY [Pseudomonadota bacterium]
MVLEIFAKLLLSYLLGSVMGGIVLGWFRGIDLREHGSKNVGATNALRVLGKPYGVGVLLIDGGKGVLAVTCIAALVLPGIDAVTEPSLMRVLCAVAVVLGHVYPVFFGFSGGKGAATLAGAAFAVIPAALPVVLTIWVITLMLTGYVGISTILGALSAPVYVAFATPGGLATPVGLFTLAMAALVLYTHRSNIGRMWRGEENRFESVMLLRRLRSR